MTGDPVRDEAHGECEAEEPMCGHAKGAEVFAAGIVKADACQYERGKAHFHAESGDAIGAKLPAHADVIEEKVTE